VICVGCVYRNSAVLQNVQFVGRSCVRLHNGFFLGGVGGWRERV
jgi:hypothetical protein